MPVHSIMLSIHAMAGLPRLLFPGTRPVITAFSILNDSCLIMCPKYPSFLAFTLCSNSGFSCNLSHTATLVSFAVHGTLRTLLAQLLSNALSFISSAFLRVQLSHPYVATGHTKAFTKRHFDFFVIPLFFSTGLSLDNTSVAIANLFLMSLLHYPSGAIFAPRY